MKRLGLFGVLGILVVIVIAVVMAGRMGETTQAYARGRVVLADNLKVSAAGVRTLFIIASLPDRPMPLGAFKKTLGSDAEGDFYEFVLTKDNLQRMMGDAQWPEQFRLKARLDRDGVAGPDQPGDLTGEVYPVHLGQDDVTIKIDHLVP